MYNSIITAIANGASRLNEISTKVGAESGLCSKYIRQLIEIGIVKKERPIKEASTKKKIYLLNDNFFRFWYKFVPQNTSAIVSGRFPQIFDKAVKPYFSDYMGLTFEGICKEYLEYHATDLPILLSEVGQWWGTDIKERNEIQIDIVGKPISGKEYIIGSCKYTNDLVGMEELEKIKNYAEVFGKGYRYHYYLFSKNGFTKGLRDYARDNGVKLFTLNDLYL